MPNLNFFKRAVMRLGTYALKAVGFDTTSVEWYARNGYPQLYSLLGGGSQSWSGESVTIQSALTNSVVWACNKIISESIGFIPAVLMREEADGDVLPAKKHPMFTAMKYAPNEELTAQALTETMTSHCVLGGNAYAYIRRRSGTGTAVGLELLMPEQVQPGRDGLGHLVYVVTRPGQPDKTYTVEPGRAQDILHIRGIGWDGVQGYSVISMASNSIGMAIAAEKNVGKFYNSGGRSPYYLQLAQTARFKTDDEFKKFRADWEATYADSSRVPIVEPWLEYKPLGMNMRDAQMLESRQFSVPEICRWFSVSPHLVGDLSRATFSNIEHLFLEFKQMTLAAWIDRWENEFWRCVLTDDEKAQGYKLRFDVNELLRGDFVTRMNGYASALQNGHMNIDEVRALEGRNKLPDGAGESYHVQLNMQDVEKIGEEPAVEPEPQKLRRLK